MKADAIMETETEEIVTLPFAIWRDWKIHDQNTES